VRVWQDKAGSVLERWGSVQISKTRPRYSKITQEDLEWRWGSLVPRNKVDPSSELALEDEHEGDCDTERMWSLCCTLCCKEEARDTKCL
jgi:hypothetical protein